MNLGVTIKPVATRQGKYSGTYFKLQAEQRRHPFSTPGPTSTQPQPARSVAEPPLAGSGTDTRFEACEPEPQVVQRALIGHGLLSHWEKRHNHLFIQAFGFLTSPDSR